MQPHVQGKKHEYSFRLAHSVAEYISYLGGVVLFTFRTARKQLQVKKKSDSSPLVLPYGKKEF